MGEPTGPAWALAEEQTFLDLAFSRRDQLAAQMRSELETAPARDAAEVARTEGLRRRVRELDHTGSGLVFGRLDGVDGVVRYLGRVGLPGSGPDEEPLVVDWRAPAARAFYSATPVHPHGLARRRHIRTHGRSVVGVDDEPLGPDARHTGLVGEGALLAALESARSGRMGTAVATLQREQDEAVRAPVRGPLVVQGGPGTGKTVVALHRVAYLLFTHPHLAAGGVLLLGPTTRFLDYIAGVLPALGETQVLATTCDRLVPGTRPERAESREVAEIKGRASWQSALAAYVASLVPAHENFSLRVEGEAHVLPAHLIAEALRFAGADGSAYHRARDRFVRRLHDLLVDAAAARSRDRMAEVEEGLDDVLARVDADLARSDDRAVHSGRSGVEIDGVLSPEDLDALRERLPRDPEVAAAVDAWWPILEPDLVLRQLLTDSALLTRWAVTLTAEEAAAVAHEPAGWSSSDIALLDAVSDLLGEQTVDDSPEPAGGFVAERAARRRDWVFGHVVVDEGQELSAMQWQMLLRRCPSRSFTVVGDVDQATGPHRHASWGEAVEAAFGTRWTEARLTICYRTPREVMELTGSVLTETGSVNRPPVAVRSTGRRPSIHEVAEAELQEAVTTAVRDLRVRHPEGSVGVIAPVSRETLRGSGPAGTDVLSATEAKGLEFDAVVVVDPNGITAEPRGRNRLYIALTRCTQDLVLLRPSPVHDRVRSGDSATG